MCIKKEEGASLKPNQPLSYSTQSTNLTNSKKIHGMSPQNVSLHPDAESSNGT